MGEPKEDVAAILIFGSACTTEATADVLSKCEIGDYLGQPEKLERFIKQRYIWVSRITMGSQANNLGQLAQQFDSEHLAQMMIHKQIFEEMIDVYGEAIPEMKLLGELEWCDAAKVTRRRLNAYLHSELSQSSQQLARECHADLQGYVEVRYKCNVMDAQSCYNKSCVELYILGQRLIYLGGFP